MYLLLKFSSLTPPAVPTLPRSPGSIRKMFSNSDATIIAKVGADQLVHLYKKDSTSLVDGEACFAGNTLAFQLTVGFASKAVSQKEVNELFFATSELNAMLRHSTSLEKDILTIKGWASSLTFTQNTYPDAPKDAIQNFNRISLDIRRIILSKFPDQKLTLGTTTYIQ